MHRSISLVALLASLVVVGIVALTSSGVAQDGAMTAAPVEGRIVARLLDNGQIEFGFQPEGEERILPRSRFFSSSSVGRWLVSSAVERDGENLGRVTAMRLQDRRVEFGFIPDGGERILPRVRFFPVNARANRWLRSSLITLWERDVTEPEAASSVPAEGTSDSDPCISRDRAVLATFYQSLDGENWRQDTNWISGQALDEWRGITTDANGCVTHIQLSSNDLKGTIPAAVSTLASLRVLDLSENNDISGVIPPALGNLSNLQSLDLSDQTGQHERSVGLTGTIPRELGKLGILQILDLSWHQLDGEIPAHLGKLTNLQSLHVHGNSRSGVIPPELGGLTRLRSLRLNHNMLRGGIPVELGNLAMLELLYLSSNHLSGAIPAALGGLTQLNTLDLGNNDLSGAIPAELGDLSRLGTLDLRDNVLSGDVPAELANLSALHSYYLHGNPLTGFIPDRFRSLESSYATYRFDDPRPPLPPFCEATVSCATGTAVPNASTNEELVSDCQNLFAARDAIVGTGTLNWSPTTPMASWTGIGLGGSPQRVKSLELSDFAGERPAQLGNLAKLETLIINGDMRGEIPPELGRLSELRELELD